MCPRSRRSSSSSRRRRAWRPACVFWATAGVPWLRPPSSPDSLSTFESCPSTSGPPPATSTLWTASSWRRPRKDCARWWLPPLPTSRLAVSPTPSLAPTSWAPARPASPRPSSPSALATARSWPLCHSCSVCRQTTTCPRASPMLSQRRPSPCPRQSLGNPPPHRSRHTTSASPTQRALASSGFCTLALAPPSSGAMACSALASS
mmetsp:Transcript_26868/g.85483  ORF Transcript_26868/g.85483 Transcript_26868/m.85483 type:complete len:205 (+) Transcript_26868:380-994(+)